MILSAVDDDVKECKNVSFDDINNMGFFASWVEFRFGSDSTKTEFI